MVDHQGEKELTKVVIDLKDETFGVETLWAKPIGNGLYRLRNVPFFAYGYSEQDVVNTIDLSGRVVVTGVAERGWHSTYRVVLP